MKRNGSAFIALLVLAAAGLVAPPLQGSPRRHKDKEAVPANDVTSRVYQIANQSLQGKFSLYLLADLYPDPTNPGSQLQRVLRVVYDKDLYFGRFAIHVRSVGKLTPDQLSTYTPEEIFNYGNGDSAEYEKINPGRFGKTGDLFLASTGGEPLATAPITPEVQAEYERLVTTYVLPAVEKLAGQKP